MPTVPRNRPSAKVYDEDKLGFGTIFTDNMLIMQYSEADGGWGPPEITPLRDLSLHPATMVLHYGQQVFEGLKAFSGPDEEDILLFRPDMNIARFNKSCARLCIPAVDPGLFMAQMSELIRKDRDWIPRSPGMSLYVRPTIIAGDPFVGVRPSKTYLFYIILSPVGAYYPEGFAPVKIMVIEDYVRACRGGLGEAKTAANYAASLLAAEIAHKEGFTQVLWLNAVDKTSIEEVGTMNIFFRINDEVITPELEGTILPGVTRDSVIKVASDWGYKVTERSISIDEVTRAAQDGSLKEVFGSGTAAVISPVSLLRHKGKDYTVADGKTGELAGKLFDEIMGIQTAARPDKYGWVKNIGK
ncbi:MAG: branched-chain amino acid aminotransferase [Thermodesulfobacteriota bacterium]